MKITTNSKLQKLPPYLFVEIDRKKKEAIDRGADIISLGVGDPDMPTPEHIVKSAQKALENPKNHQYPFGSGMFSFRKAVADWYKARFNVSLNPENEVCALIGSKEGMNRGILFIIQGQFLQMGSLILCHYLKKMDFYQI